MTNFFNIEIISEIMIISFYLIGRYKPHAAVGIETYTKYDLYYHPGTPTHGTLV